MPRGVWRLLWHSDVVGFNLFWRWIHRWNNLGDTGDLLGPWDLLDQIAVLEQKCPTWRLESPQRGSPKANWWHVGLDCKWNAIVVRHLVQVLPAFGTWSFKTNPRNVPRDRSSCFFDGQSWRAEVSLKREVYYKVNIKVATATLACYITTHSVFTLYSNELPTSVVFQDSHSFCVQ